MWTMKYMKTLDIVKSSEGEIGVPKNIFLKRVIYGFGGDLHSGSDQ